MERKAKNRKIISGIIVILACLSLMACENSKLLSSSVKSSESAEESDVLKLTDSEETLQLAESQESLAQEDAGMEEDSFVSSDILDKYCGVEKKAEQTLAVFAREAREEGEEKQKFQKQIE